MGWSYKGYKHSMKKKCKLPWNWKSRLVLESEVTDYTIEYTLAFRKGTTPKGFSRHIGTFMYEDQRIHSDVDEYFQNRGLGMLCYRTILHEHGELVTCYHAASSQAKAIWNKLVKLYPYETEFWTSFLKITSKGQFVGLPVILQGG